ncbi:MAG: EamA family transporter [Candidatus Omnitrophota bacterium]|nr:EamA family transporter [Candidatus Omnitrophota bacterium]
MKNKGYLTLKIFILIVLNDIFDGVAQILIKKGFVITGISDVTFGNISEFVLRNALSPLVLSGILVGFLSCLLWFVILSRIDLSIALPVGSTIYIFVPVMAIFFLHEEISLLRWAGIFLIVAGIYCVANSKHSAKGLI